MELGMQVIYKQVSATHDLSIISEELNSLLHVYGCLFHSHLGYNFNYLQIHTCISKGKHSKTSSSHVSSYYSKML